MLLSPSCFLLAQEDTVLFNGNVSIGANDVDGIHVRNKTANRVTITDAYGYFSIPVRLHDTLVFSAIHLKEKQIVINEILLKTNAVVVHLEEV